MAVRVHGTKQGIRKIWSVKWIGPIHISVRSSLLFPQSPCLCLPIVIQSNHGNRNVPLPLGRNRSPQPSSLLCCCFGGPPLGLPGPRAGRGGAGGRGRPQMPSPPPRLLLRAHGLGRAPLVGAPHHAGQEREAERQAQGAHRGQGGPGGVQALPPGPGGGRAPLRARRRARPRTQDVALRDHALQQAPRRPARRGGRRVHLRQHRPRRRHHQAQAPQDQGEGDGGAARRRRWCGRRLGRGAPAARRRPGGGRRIGCGRGRGGRADCCRQGGAHQGVRDAAADGGGGAGAAGQRGPQLLLLQGRGNGPGQHPLPQEGRRLRPHHPQGGRQLRQQGHRRRCATTTTRRSGAVLGRAHRRRQQLMILFFFFLLACLLLL